MSLRATIAAALKQGFKALDDIPRPVTYRAQSGDPVRDLDTGTSTLAHTDYVLKQVVIARFTSQETDKDRTLLDSEKMIILSDDLPVVPAAADIVIDEENVVWEVIKRLRDPAGVIKIVQVRSTR